MTQDGDENLVIRILSLQKRKPRFKEGLQTQRVQDWDVKHDLAGTLVPVLLLFLVCHLPQGLLSPSICPTHSFTVHLLRG